MRDEVEERSFMTEMMPTPTTNGETPLPKRASKGMLPSTWLSREVRLEYTDADGKAAQTSGVLLDWCPAGEVLSIFGAETLLAWERLVLVEQITSSTGFWPCLLVLLANGGRAPWQNPSVSTVGTLPATKDGA